MSIKTKMTAIADRLRAMLGTSDALSLDGMADALDTQAAQVANGFAAVADMGGTVPVTQLAASLPDAIRTIPTGVAVQVSTGTFTTGSSGSASVSCGFQPDFIAVACGSSGMGGAGGSGYYYQAAASYDLSSSGSLASVAEGTSMGFDLIYVLFSRSSSGFSVMMKYFDYDWSGGAVARKTFSYIAVKYTA